MMAYVEQTPPRTRPNPQKRNLLLQRLKKAPLWLLIIILVLIYIYSSYKDDPIYQTIWNGVEEGIEVTIRVTLRAYSIALILGLVLALMRMSNNFVLYQTSTLFVEVVRGIPTLILVFYVAYGLTPQLIEWSQELGKWLVAHEIDPFGKASYFANLTRRQIIQLNRNELRPEYRVIVALAISYAAFLSEIFRAGLQSIEKGQIEAAKSLGLNRWQSTVLIVLPQAIRIILPPLGNDFIAMLKESSLVSVVGVPDITRRGQDLATGTFRVFQTYNIVALTYLVLTLSLALVVKVIEFYLKDTQTVREFVRSIPRRIYALVKQTKMR